MTRPLSFVVAMGENRVIGRDNRLIWRIKSDLKFFRQHTIGRPVIMGRKTRGAQVEVKIEQALSSLG